MNFILILFFSLLCPLLINKAKKLYYLPVTIAGGLLLFAGSVIGSPSPLRAILIQLKHCLFYTEQIIDSAYPLSLCENLFYLENSYYFETLQMKQCTIQFFRILRLSSLPGRRLRHTKYKYFTMDTNPEQTTKHNSGKLVSIEFQNKYMKK